jgi:hypothetical protein
MGQNLATLVAPQGITVNIVGFWSLVLMLRKLTVCAGVSSHDWVNRNDSPADIRVRSTNILFQHFG